MTGIIRFPRNARPAKVTKPSSMGPSRPSISATRLEQAVEELSPSLQQQQQHQQQQPQHQQPQHQQPLLEHQQQPSPPKEYNPAVVFDNDVHAAAKQDALAMDDNGDDVEEAASAGAGTGTGTGAENNDSTDSNNSTTQNNHNAHDDDDNMAVMDEVLGMVRESAAAAAAAVAVAEAEQGPSDVEMAAAAAVAAVQTGLTGSLGGSSLTGSSLTGSLTASSGPLTSSLTGPPLSGAVPSSGALPSSLSSLPTPSQPLQDPPPPPSSQDTPETTATTTTSQLAIDSGYDGVRVESALAKRLSRCPGRRPARQRRPEQQLNLARRSNVEALFAHIAGVEAAAPCKNCHKGHGPWSACVVVDGQMCGSCANCWFNASGARCSFHDTKMMRPLLPTDLQRPLSYALPPTNPNSTATIPPQHPQPPQSQLQTPQPSSTPIPQQQHQQHQQQQQPLPPPPPPPTTTVSSLAAAAAAAAQQLMSSRLSSSSSSTSSSLGMHLAAALLGGSNVSSSSSTTTTTTTTTTSLVVDQALADVRQADRATRELMMVEIAAKQLALAIVRYGEAVGEEASGGGGLSQTTNGSSQENGQPNGKPADQQPDGQLKGHAPDP